MINGRMKKYAAELGFTFKNGVAYGVLGGYMTTLKNDSYLNHVTFAVTFPDENGKAAVQSMIFDGDFQKKYFVSNCQVTNSLVALSFANTPKAMKTVSEALNLITEKMSSSDVKGVDFCNCCNTSFSGFAGEDVLINGNVFRMHSGCIDKITAEKSEISESVKKQGNVFTGIIGAVIGALIGVIPWAVVGYFGWVVGWLGFLIGIAAKKGYEICRGKETKVKGVVIIVVVFLSVMLAEYCSQFIAFIGAVKEYTVVMPPLGPCFELFNAALFSEAEYIAPVIFNVILGWIFAGLGIAGVIREIFGKANAVSSLPVRLGERKEN